MRYPLLEGIAKGRDLTEITVRVAMPRATTRRDLTSVEIRFDQVTDDMIEAFANGECTILATALHQITGWPFLNVLFDCQLDGCWHHIGVSTPDGGFLDIRGPRAPHAACDRLPGEESFPRKESLANQHPGTRYWLQEASLPRLANDGYVPHSGRVQDFASMIESFDPLFGEAALFLAEQIIAAPDWGVLLERAA